MMKRALRPAFVRPAAQWVRWTGTQALPGSKSLKDADPEMFKLIESERKRQFEGLEMIASENFTSKAVMECLGSCLTNKYAEGYPGARYYGGNQYVDLIENLCQKRALEAFRLSPEEWAVNVQPYSGSPANLAAYSALLQPHERLMGLHLPDGGHLTHGYQLPNGKKVSKVSAFFESVPYFVKRDGLIDYDNLATVAQSYRPKLIICGYSAYPRDLDYKRLRQIADSVGANLLCDMAHFSGLVAAGEMANPFEFADVVTSTTHKSLRGPRSGLIFSRKIKNGEPTGFDDAVQQAVFPGLQGGPHVHQIAAVATQLKEVNTEEFKQYAKQVKANASALAKAMVEQGLTISTGGTDNHLVLWDVRPHGLTGSKVEKLLELAHISTNKNTLPGDKSAVTPGGVRIGTPALTTRGFTESEMQQIAGFLKRAISIAESVQKTHGKKLKDFTNAIEKNDEVSKLGGDVIALASKFPMPGI